MSALRTKRPLCFNGMLFAFWPECDEPFSQTSTEIGRKASIHNVTTILGYVTLIHIKYL